jgi:hypothetical protein
MFLVTALFRPIFDQIPVRLKNPILADLFSEDRAKLCNA